MTALPQISAPLAAAGNETLIVLGIGVASIAATAALLARIPRSAVWQRTIWQMAVVGALGLTVGELSGLTRLAAWPLRQFTATLREVGTAKPIVPPAATNLRLNLAPELLTETDDARTTAALVSHRDQPTFAGANDLAFTPVWHNRLESATSAATENSLDANDADWASTPLRGKERSEAPAAATVVLAEAPQGWSLVSLAPRLAAAVWLVGSLAFLLLWLRETVRGWRALRACHPTTDQRLRAEVDALARALGLRRRVRILECGRLGSPAAVGVWRPTLLLPPGFAVQRASRREAILAHEVAHLAAGDSLWLAASQATCVALWWQPLAWWMRRQLRMASEHAADEASLLVPDGPAHLAEGLVALGRSLLRRRQLGWLAASGGGFRSELGRRVERLLRLPPRAIDLPAARHLAAARIVLPVGLVLLAICCTAWAHGQALPSQGDSSMNMFRSAWRSSLAATALWSFTGGGGALAAEHAAAPPAFADVAEMLPPEMMPADAPPADMMFLAQGGPGAFDDEFGPPGPPRGRGMRGAGPQGMGGPGMGRGPQGMGPPEDAEEGPRGPGGPGEQPAGPPRMPPPPRFDGPQADTQRKLFHVQMAIANLRDAGMDEAVARLSEVADKLRDELKSAGVEAPPMPEAGGPDGPRGPRGEGRRGRGGPGGPGSPEGPGGPEGSMGPGGPNDDMAPGGPDGPQGRRGGPEGRMGPGGPRGRGGPEGRMGPGGPSGGPMGPGEPGDDDGPRMRGPRPNGGPGGGPDGDTAIGGPRGEGGPADGFGPPPRDGQRPPRRGPGGDDGFGGPPREGGDGNGPPRAQGERGDTRREIDEMRQEIQELKQLLREVLKEERD